MLHSSFEFLSSVSKLRISLCPVVRLLVDCILIPLLITTTARYLHRTKELLEVLKGAFVVHTLPSRPPALSISHTFSITAAP